MTGVYCSTTDIKDGIISGIISQDHIDEANIEVERQALQLGVLPSQIPSNAPDQVKSFAVAYACWRAAFYNYGANINKLMSKDGEDVYQIKAKDWYKEYERLRDQLTPEIIMGTAKISSETIPVIELFRS